MNSKIKRVALPLGAAVILGSSGFAFMASNSVPNSFAGDGTGSISGYNVSGIEYATNDNFIFSVKFDLDGVARAENVSAFIIKTDGTQVEYASCNKRAGTENSYICDPQNGVVAQRDAKSLRVIAAQ